MYSEKTIGSSTEKQERIVTRVYVLDGISIVPHYTMPNMYMAPGGLIYTEQYISLIAEYHKDMQLWPRNW